MSGRFEIINPLTCPDWNDMLPAAAGCSFFHTSNWARVLHDAYGYRPVYLAAIENGRLAALVPMMEVKSALTGARGVSLPFTDVCEQVISDDCRAEEALPYLIELGKNAGWKYIEFRGQRLLPENTPSHSSFYHHTLTLRGGEESIMAGFRTCVKNNIRKAEASGVNIAMHTNLGAMKEFYRLHCMTRKLHGVPPQPFSFFRGIHEHVISQGHGFILLASHKGETIAGAVFFHFSGSVIFKFSASNRRYQSLRPNNLVIWSAIRWYTKEGFKDLSFGRTDPHADGLRRFKLSWGTREEIIRYYHYDMKQGIFANRCPEIPGACTAICRRLPITVLKFAGALLYRHIG